MSIPSTAEAVTKGHVQFSISLAFVAGYNATSGTPNKDFFLSEKSINPTQMKTFRDFCRMFYTAYPGGQVLGYNDLIGDPRLGPGFTVEEYVAAGGTDATLLRALRTVHPPRKAASVRVRAP